MIRRALHDGWTVAPKLGAFEQPADGAGPVPVVLPHDAIRDLPRSADSDQGVNTGYHPGGVFEYATTLDVPAAWRDRTVQLEFEGVYRDAIVLVDGDVVAHEPNGYNGFVVDLDSHLRPGATQRISVEARAHRDSRWYSGAGIYRPVHLVVADPVHIPLGGTTVTTPDIDGERAIVEIATAVVDSTRHARTLRLAWQVTDPGGAVVATADAPVTVLPGEPAVARARIAVDGPALWHPDSPSLYRVRASLADAGAEIDSDAVEFGIRRVQVDPARGLRINGEPVLLRGACVHHDNGPLGAATFDDAEDRRVRLLKAAGFNALRSAHNPMSRAMLEACDRHGVLVMDELTDVWTRSKTAFDGAPTFPDRWRRDVAAMVAKDRNHPSVVMYSIGNEILELGTPHGAAWSRRIAEEVRALDPTRIVTNGINGVIANLSLIAEEMGGPEASDPNTMMAEMGERMARMNASSQVSDSIEESASVLDVVGFNYADSRYRQDAEQYPHRVIVGSETFPAHIPAMWALVEELPHVIGDFTWTGWDYLGESGIGRVDRTDVDGYVPTGTAGPFPYLTAECGDLDITGHRRTISYYREIVFGLRTAPYLAVHRPQHHGRPTATTPWSWDDSVASWSWDVSPGSPVVVDAYADADEVELLLDGVAVGTAPVGEAAPFLARFETTWHPGELTAVARRDGVEVGRHVLRSAGGPLRLVVRPETEGVAPDGLAYVAITIEDAAGIVPCDADRQVAVRVDGGELAGLGTGRARTEESFGGRRSRRTTDACSRSCDRPAPATSASRRPPRACPPRRPTSASTEQRSRRPQRRADVSPRPGLTDRHATRARSTPSATCPRACERRC
ncbi:glycoside hydrolase family 2 TIM barrel-domain containing protein [Agromyces mangrovi Wang et al. 2018]|uniref:glycoside hydrolase family 2 TIM barrel-domain containing protein n=1 Tax=Agromyces mangrovi TaxID=1858653 RepID=UPI0025738E3C|nr:glycoside hydrolase family 2 TIM barrel-domain containing protein [Agromyces mangrovi]BDZ63940.1 beta-galactosidase [Agromyces mangrovi]